MKKMLVVFSLVLVIAVSVIAGTLAMYTTTIDDLASGSVVAKEFVLLENGTDTFTQNVKIAPTETVTYTFGVKNYNDSVVSETAMKLDVSIDVAAAANKSAIDPLVVTVKNEDGTVVGTQTGVGTINFSDDFALAASGQSHTYTVTITWPSDNSVDYSYAGANFGTALNVSVTGTQE